MSNKFDYLLSKWHLPQNTILIWKIKIHPYSAFLRLSRPGERFQFTCRSLFAKNISNVESFSNCYSYNFIQSVKTFVTPLPCFVNQLHERKTRIPSANLFVKYIIFYSVSVIFIQKILLKKTWSEPFSKDILHTFWCQVRW